MDLHPIPQKEFKKPAISANQFPGLKYSYFSSTDGIDEHLLVLFHGLGDHHSNFIQFGLKMQLPQTAILAIGAPCRIPLMDLDEGSAWFPLFTDDGDDVPPTSTIAREGLEMSRRIICSFMEKCIFGKWEGRKVLLLGFSQGGTMALDLAIYLANIDHRYCVGGVVSICGWLEEGMRRTALKSQLDILVLQGDKDSRISVAEWKIKEMYLGSLLQASSNLDVALIQGKDHSMPKDYVEMQRIMKFFASHMQLRNLKLEQMSDVFEVK